MNDANRTLRDLLDLHGADLNAWPDRLADLKASILAQVEPQAQRRRVFSNRTLMRLAASLVLACGIGVGVGQIVPDPADSRPDALDQLLLGAYQPPADDGDG